VRFLLLTEAKRPHRWPEEIYLGDPERPRCFSALWAYQLVRHLRALGHKVGCAPLFSRQADADALFSRIPGRCWDAVVALGNRHFSKVSPRVLRERGRGVAPLIAQFWEGGRVDPDVDLTLCARDPGPMPRSRCIGWAADPNLFVPRQRQGALVVLLDHANYCAGEDRTYQILLSLREVPESIEARQFVTAGVERHDLSRPVVVHEFSRSPSVPQSAIARELGEAHIFVVTHQEALGLCALEAAMAGALVATPEGFIPPDRLATINHVLLPAEGVGLFRDWRSIRSHVRPTRNRQRALEHTWRSLARRFVAAIREGLEEVHRAE